MPSPDIYYIINLYKVIHTEVLVRMVDKLSIVSCLIIFFASGCALFTNPQGVMALKRYGDNQAQIQSYVDRQVKLFDKLVEDLKAQKLEAGTSQKDFMRLYGEPVLSSTTDDPQAGEVFLYRHPMEYFNTDRVYAYFDETGSLVRWEYKPAAQ